MLAKYSGPDTNTIVLYKGYISNKRPLVFTASQYAIMLMHSQQKSFKDIAKELELNEGTVKSRWHRGTMVLKRIQARQAREQAEAAAQAQGIQN